MDVGQFLGLLRQQIQYVTRERWGRCSRQRPILRSISFLRDVRDVNRFAWHGDGAPLCEYWSCVVCEQVDHPLCMLLWPVDIIPSPSTTEMSSVLLFSLRTLNVRQSTLSSWICTTLKHASIIAAMDLFWPITTTLGLWSLCNLLSVFLVAAVTSGRFCKNCTARCGGVLGAYKFNYWVALSRYRRFSLGGAVRSNISRMHSLPVWLHLPSCSGVCSSAPLDIIRCTTHTSELVMRRCSCTASIASDRMP